MCREKRLKLPVFKGILMSQKCLTVFGGYHCSRVSLYPQRFIMILTPMHHRFDTCGIEPISLAKILHGKKKTDIWTSRKIWLLRAWAHVWYVFFNIINRTKVITLFLKYYGLSNSPAIQPPHAVIKNPLKCLVIKKNELVRILLADQKSLSLLCPLTAHSKPYGDARPYHKF